MTSHPIPNSSFDLFCSFTLIGLQGFGGVAPILQRELVEKKQWMTKQEFIEEWAVAQIMPGPNVMNLALNLGARHFGVRGALAASIGLLLLPMIIVMLLGLLFSQFSNHPIVDGALRGMGAVAAGLIMATGFQLFEGLDSNPLGKKLCIVFGVLCFIGVALLQWPLLGVFSVLGLFAWLFAYRRLKS